MVLQYNQSFRQYLDRTELLLIQREYFSNRRSYESAGFTNKDLRYMVKSDSLLNHSGCVNTVNWINNGEKLLTGSDDKKIKIWNTAGSFDSNKMLLGTIPTEHYSNIFCVDYSELYERLLFSCAADGTLRSTDIEFPTGGSLLVDSDKILHMFMFAKNCGHVIYTAEECGLVRQLDLRCSADQSMRLYEHPEGAVKSLVQSPSGDGNTLIVGGAGLVVREIDLRRGQTASAVIRSWSPESYPHARFRQVSEVSVSGLCASKDGTRLCVSYQGDQIYFFPFGGSNIDSPLPTHCLGGHINHDTFLKVVHFFGPRDEYVVSGSDSGDIWIWDSNSGRLWGLESGSQAQQEPVQVVNILRADDRTCNGAVPHPYLPVLASYGIDSDAKLWLCHTPTDDEVENSECDFSRWNLLLERNLNLAIGRQTEDVVAKRLLAVEPDPRDQSLPKGASPWISGFRVSDHGMYRRLVANVRRSLYQRIASKSKLLKRTTAGLPFHISDLGYSWEQNGLQSSLDGSALLSILKAFPGADASQWGKVLGNARVAQALRVLLELLRCIEKAKTDGNANFKNGNWESAVSEYKDGSRYVPLLRKVWELAVKATVSITSRERSPALGNGATLEARRGTAQGTTDDAGASDTDVASEHSEFAGPYSVLLPAYLDYLWATGTEGAGVALLERTLLSNEAAAWLQMGRGRDASRCCALAMEVRASQPGRPAGAEENLVPPDSKLMFRKGCASLLEKNYEAAVEALSSCLSLGGDEAVVGKKLKEAKRFLLLEKSAESNKYKNMFSKGGVES